MMELRLIPLDGMASSPVTFNEFPVLVGRHPDCDLQILYPLLSRHHCRFFTKQGEVWIQDLESMNGTTLNGRLVELPVEVRPGDEIGFPCHRFRAEVSRCGCGLADSKC